MEWPPVTKIDGETEALKQLVENGWAWQWPGWKWVADSLNKEFENDRTPVACRLKYKSLLEGWERDKPKGELSTWDCIYDIKKLLER